MKPCQVTHTLGTGLRGRQGSILISDLGKIRNEVITLRKGLRTSIKVDQQTISTKVWLVGESELAGIGGPCAPSTVHWHGCKETVDPSEVSLMC